MATALDLGILRDQFPALNQEVRGRPLIYLDNAATTQKPWAVLREMQRYYQHDNANVHRGVHKLSQRATESFDAARVKLQKFVGAEHSHEIIFTKGCTEAINLVAHSWGLANLKPGDEILLSGMEHHADIVPWQLVAERTGATVRPIPILPSGELDLEAYGQMLSEKTRLVGCVHASNALGTINPVQKMAEMAHAVGALFLADGAQMLAHGRVDVRELGVDFYAMSAHKMYGPTGVGALYGRAELLEAMPPFQGGGDMIRTVSWDGTTFAGLPNKFEPGTPNIAGVIGWGAALDWLGGFDPEAIHAHEMELLRVATATVEQIPGARVVGTAEKVAVVSFVMEQAHPHDIGTMLDQQAIAIRTGHHCCMPLMKSLGVPATARASFALYNEVSEAEALGPALLRVAETFG